MQMAALATGADGPELVGAVDEAMAGDLADRRFDPGKTADRLRRGRMSSLPQRVAPTPSRRSNRPFRRVGGNPEPCCLPSRADVRLAQGRTTAVADRVRLLHVGDSAVLWVVLENNDP